MSQVISIHVENTGDRWKVTIEKWVSESMYLTSVPDLIRKVLIRNEWIMKPISLVLTVQTPTGKKNTVDYLLKELDWKIMQKKGNEQMTLTYSE